MDADVTDHGPLHRLRGSNARQIAATLLLAVALAASAWIGESASSGWQSAVRAEVGRSATINELVRHVYVGEASIALQVAVAQTRGTALGRAAEAEAGPGGESILLEADEDLEWAWQLRRSHASMDHLINDSYWQDGEGYDVAARIVDLQEERGADAPRDPETLLRSADGKARLAQWVAGAGIPMVVLYLILEVVDSPRRDRSGRDASASPAASADDVGVAPSLGHPTAGARLPRVVALMAWALLGILPLAQQQAQQAADRADAQSSRAAVQTTNAMAAGSQAISFVLNAERDLSTQTMRIGARANAAPLASADRAAAENVAVQAHLSALDPVTAVVTSMTKLPTAEDGLDAAFADALRSGPAEWTHLQSEQVRLLDEAAEHGRTARALSVALLLASLTLTLATVAQAPAAGRARLVRAGPVALVLLTLTIAFLGLTA